jgi:hypothetical protein
MADKPVKKTKSNLPGAGPGRPKGVPNKVSGLAKDAVARVFEEIGGVENMAEWARENQTAFYNLYSKLLPLQVNGAGPNGEHLVTGINVSFVRPDAPG